MFFKKGELDKVINMDQAQTSFLKSLNCGTIFDARIRKASMKALMSLNTDPAMQAQLQRQYANFEHCHRDFIIMICNNQAMEPYLQQITS